MLTSNVLDEMRHCIKDGSLSQGVRLSILSEIVDKAANAATPDHNDFITHRDAWLGALSTLYRMAQEDGDEDNMLYWRHEITRFEEAYHHIHEWQKSLQDRGAVWVSFCHGDAILMDKDERNRRFLEEALELVQAANCDRDVAHQLVDYVYDRPVGELDQELGGVMITLAALAHAHGTNMHVAGEVELARIWTKIDAIRAKQKLKPKHVPRAVAA